MRAALRRVEEEVLRDHVSHCVEHAITSVGLGPAAWRELLPRLAEDPALRPRLHYVGTGGLRRGSVLYSDAEGDLPVVDADVTGALPELFRLRLDGGALDDVIQVTSWDGVGEPTFAWRPRRAIPDHAEAFENTWRSYRETKNIT